MNSLTGLNALIVNNIFYIIIGVGFILLVLFFLLITAKMDISDLRQRYKKMMGESDGLELERMLNEHADIMKRISGDMRRVDGEISNINALLEKAITRVAIIRYNAFDDTSSDLSFSLALLDDNNTGVIISSLYGRDTSQTYAKPIINGNSPQYKLTDEEIQVLKEASISPVRK